MGSHGNFIKLLLQARKSRTWYTGKFSEAQANVDLILIQVSGVIISERALSKKWQWSRNTVRRFLKMNQQMNQPVNHTKPLNTVSYEEKDASEYTNKYTTKLKQEYTEKFLLFWEKYPVKKSKGAAFQAWQKNEKPTLEIILQAIESQIKEKTQLRISNLFCPEWKYPSTWINQRCWEDEVTETKTPQTAPHLQEVKDMDTGEPMPIEEVQRRLGQLVDGMKEL